MSEILIVDADGHTFERRQVPGWVTVETKQIEGKVILYVGNEAPEEFIPEEFQEVRITRSDGTIEQILL